jgi:hypothetical protein
LQVEKLRVADTLTEEFWLMSNGVICFIRPDRVSWQKIEWKEEGERTQFTRDMFALLPSAYSNAAIFFVSPTFCHTQLENRRTYFHDSLYWGMAPKRGLALLIWLLPILQPF